MRKLNFLFLVCLVCLGFISNNANAYINFTSVPDSTVTVGESYTYQVTVSHDGTGLTFALLEKPSTMSISAGGLITWTPTSLDKSCRVVVKASNSNTVEKLQTYYLYVSGAPTCPSGLISNWTLDETEGDVFADNYGGNNATHQGSSSILYDTIGVVGKGQVFNPTSATDAFMVVPNSEDFIWGKTDNFSISLWFQFSGRYHVDQNQILVGRSDGNSFIAIGIRHIGVANEPVNPRLNFLISTAPDGDDTYDSCVVELSTDGDRVLDKQWHHVVGVYEGGSLQRLSLYYDGVNLGSLSGYTKWKNDDFLVDDITKKLNIGGSPILGGNAYDGKMDELAIFSKSLSSTEVTALYNKGLSHLPTCTPGNSAPVITSVPVDSVYEDQAYSYTLKYRDIDANTITKSKSILPSWLTFNTTTGVLSGTPTNANVSDTAKVKLNINDGTVTVSQIFNIKVINVNDIPAITSTPVTQVNEDIAYTYNVAASDEDMGDAIVLSTSGTLPSWLNFTDNGNGTGLLTGTPTNNEVGTDAYRDYSVTIKATDNKSTPVEQTFTIRVTNINDAPVITGQSVINVNEDDTVTITINQINLTDVDDTYPTDHTVTVKSGTNYTFIGNKVIPIANYNGSLTVPVEVSDGVAKVNYNLIVTVVSVNDAPVYTGQAPVLLASEGSAYSYTFSGTDVDNATLTYGYTKKPSWLTFTSSAIGGALQGTPTNVSQNQKDTVIITISDGTITIPKQFVIDVKNENDPPSFTSTAVTVGDDYVVYEYVLGANDPDEDPFTFIEENVPAWLSIVNEADVMKLKGTPAHINVGNNVVKIGVTDGIDTSFQNFTIDVQNINDLPVVTSVPEESTEIGAPYAYQLVVTDVDEDDVIIITAKAIPSWLDYDVDSKILSGMPSDGDNNKLYNVQFEISDGHGVTDHTFTIKVGTVGLDEVSDIIGRIYPVPVRNDVTFEFSNSKAGSLQILDLNGKLIKEIDVEGLTKTTVDLSGLPANLYIYKIVKENQIQLGKIIKE